MAALETIRNVSIGIAIMALIPVINYVGTSIIVENPRHPAENDIKENYDKQMQVYKEKSRRFEKYYFYMSAVVGLLSIIAGLFIIPIPFVSMGFVLGGTFCLTSGYYTYWSQLPNVFKLVSLLIALILLIAGSFRIIKPKQEK